MDRRAEHGKTLGRMIKQFGPGMANVEPGHRAFGASRLARFDVAERLAGTAPALPVQVVFGLACFGAFLLGRVVVDIFAPTAGPYALIYPILMISTLFGRWPAGFTVFVTALAWTWNFVVSTNPSRLSPAALAERLVVNGIALLIILVFAEIFRRAVRISSLQRDAALAELQDRETRIRMAMEAGRLGSWTLDVNTGELTSSDACRAIFGRTSDQSFSYDDLAHSVHKDDRERMRAAVQRSVTERTPYDIEYRILTPMEELRWVQIRAEPIQGKDGGLCLTGVSLDITDRKRGDARRDTLAMLTDAFRDLSFPAEIAHAAARVLGETLGVDRVGFATVDRKARTLRIDRDWAALGSENEVIIIPLDAFEDVAAEINRGEAIGIADVRLDPRTVGRAVAMEARGAIAVINVGVLDQGELVAVLYVNNARVRAWSEEDLALAREIAERTWMATERIRAAAALRDANESLEAKVAARTHDLMRAEEALRQSQKMEAVGQLTGGIAHDFNNLLAGISGSLELLERRIGQGRLTDAERYIGSAQGAARRAASLTQRLLAFSRRQTLDPRPTDVNKLVDGMEDLIRRSVGPDVDVEVTPASELWATKVDPSQLENALLNLCINARDAMAPDGGRVIIETGNSILDEHSARAQDMAPGEYVSLCVSDTGVGMAPDVIARAFDPFYTTKPIGQGTGLGLSMVYGFVRQSGGQVRIHSEPGAGATICLYLPRFIGGAEAAEVVRETAIEQGAGETVLVIDDDATVRLLVVEILEENGYATLEAEDGPSGLRVLQSDVRIDLLITDVGLPGGMNGRQVADAARIGRPGLKVLFITGYVQAAAVGNGLLEEGMKVITKPFAMATLGAKVRELIAE